jgi:4-amino-4-deoxychorismate lyase
MDKSLQALGFKNHYDLQQLISPPDNELYRCRIVYDERTVTITYLPYTKRIISTLQLVQADQLEYALKYADRNELDTLFEQRSTADDVLIIKDGLVTDTTIANIAFFDGKQWLTPRSPLLQGTTRARLLNEKQIYEADIRPSDLNYNSEFALLNAMIGFSQIKNGIILPTKS